LRQSHIGVRYLIRAHADGFALAALARLGEMLAPQRLVSGADRIELVGLGAVA
jgi:hypothetical protein